MRHFKGFEIEAPPPLQIFPNKHPVGKIELEKTETLFPNKPENTRLRKAPHPLRYQILGRALVLTREYHCTGAPSFYTLAVLISLTIRVLSIIPQARCTMWYSCTQEHSEETKKSQQGTFHWEDSIQGPTECNACDTTNSATQSGFHTSREQQYKY